MSEVPLVVGDHLSHVLDIFFGVLVLLLVRVALEDVDDLGTRVVAHGLARVAVGPTGGGGVVGFEPLLELRSCHVDELVELFDDIGVGFDHGGRLLGKETFRVGDRRVDEVQGRCDSVEWKVIVR